MNKEAPVETEVKILQVNKEAVLAKLQQLGAVLKKEVFQTDQYFSLKQKEVKRTIRIRREENTAQEKKAFITIKQKKSNDEGIRSRHEFEEEIANPDVLENIFLAMGLEKKEYYETKRMYFLLNDCSVELVKRPTIPLFLEIEGNKEAIIAVAKQLGFLPDDFLRESLYTIYPQEKSDLRFSDEDN